MARSRSGVSVPALDAVERRLEALACGDAVAGLSYLVGVDEPRFFFPFMLSAARKHDPQPCEEILARLDAFLSRAPASARAHALRGRTLRSLERAREALDAFDAALRLAPGDGRALGWRGELLLHSEGLTARSVADLTAAAQALPDSPWPSVWAAAALLADSAGAEVFAALDAALAAAPRHVPALLLRAIAHERCGRFDAGRVDAAAAVRRAPSCVGALVLRGRLEARSGDAAAAQATFAAATRMEPDAKGFYMELIAPGLLSRPAKEQLASLDDFIRARPKSAWAYALRGDLMRTPVYDRMEAGREDLEKAVSLDGRTPWMRACLARSYVQYRNYPRGLKELRAALARDPRCAWLHSWIGETYRNMGRGADALRSMRRAIALSPRFAQPHVWMGRVHCEAGRWREGVEEFTRAIRMDCDYGFAYFKRGHAWAELGRHAEAAADFERALALDPRDPDLIRKMLARSLAALSGSPGASR